MLYSNYVDFMIEPINCGMGKLPEIVESRNVGFAMGGKGDW